MAELFEESFGFGDLAGEGIFLEDFLESAEGEFGAIVGDEPAGEFEFAFGELFVFFDGLGEEGLLFLFGELNLRLLEFEFRGGILGRHRPLTVFRTVKVDYRRGVSFGK